MVYRFNESSEERDKLVYLNEKNIITRDSYPALSFQKYLKEIQRTDLTNSESISNQILWLPSSTILKDEEIEVISDHINKFKFI